MYRREKRSNDSEYKRLTSTHPNLRLTAAAAACLLVIACGLTESLDGYGGGTHDPKDASSDQGQAGTGGDASIPDSGGSGGDASFEDADASLDAQDAEDAQEAGDSAGDSGDDAPDDGAADAEGGLDAPDDGPPCGALQKSCGGNCVDLDDPAYGCGPTDCSPCPAPPHMSTVCQGTQCAAGTCSQGWTNCNTSTDDGCEVQTSSDPDNCGACGDACSGYHVPTRICSNGECVGACGSHYEDCNNDRLTDGCETDIDTDTDHCGACGRACSTDNVTGALSCAAGVCNTTSCFGGWSNLNLPAAPEPDDGCEHHN